MAGQGLPTDDYHPSFEDEWYASSKMLELDDGLFPNSLAYYVEGDHRAVKRLKLKLNINNQDQAAGAEERLWAAAQELLHVALDGEQAQEAAAAIRSAETIDLIFDQRRVQLRREDFAGSRGGYSRTFKIEHASREK